MKTSKRIWLGLSAFLFVFTLILSVFPAEKTLAAGSASSKQDVIDCGNSLKFVSIAELTCTFGGTTAHFIDQNPSDSGTSSNDYFNVNYSPDASFCNQGIDGLKSTGLTKSGYYYHSGVTRRGSTNAFKLSDAGKPIDIKLNVGYINAKDQCVRIDSSNQDYTIPGARTGGIRTLLQFGSQTLDSLDNVSNGTLSGKSYNLVGGFTYNKDTVVYTDGFSPGSCSGEVVTVNTSNKSAVRYNLNGDGANHNIAQDYPGLAAFLKAQNTAGCYVHEGDTNFGLGSGSFDVSGTPPTSSDIAQAPVAGSTQGGQSINSSSDCAANSGGFSLSWLMCPVAQAAVSLTDEFIGLFEDQLSFKVSDLGSTTGAASGYSQTKASWAIIRDVASSLIVIFMLVMVLSQAISWGPFDAYTVKKLLPKLVVAIVVMQISWDLFVWVVGLFDDLGHGIADIMYLPFGGPSNMDFWHLLGNAHISAWTMGTLDWAALAAGAVAISMAFLPAFLGLITAALMSLAFGLFTLVFRKILIIMLLILSPLALVAWILPGTASYWKMWRENFIKALTMFPLAMGLIAAGRIFAKVAGAQSGNGTFLNMIFVFVGFFGPLFILPKTFKWGGQAMQMAGNSIMKARDKANALPQKYFKDRQTDWNNRNKARSQLRVAYGEGFNWRKVSSYWTTPLDKIGSHQWDPLLYGKNNKSSRRSKIMHYKEAGHKVEEEEQNLNDREAAYEENRLDKTRYNHDDLWQDKLNGHKMRNYNQDGKVNPDELTPEETKSRKNYSGEYMNEWIKNNRLENESDDSVKARFMDERRKLSYAERDFYEWKAENPNGTFEQFKKSDAYGYKDYSKKLVEVHDTEDKFERAAALNMLSKFGGPNHPEIVRYLYQEMAAGGDREREAREWMQDHVDFILKVYPQMLKGLSSTATAPSFVGMHQVGFRDELGRLIWNVNNGKTPGDRQKNQVLLRQMVQNLVANMASNERNGIETDIRVIMKAIAGDDKATLKNFNDQILDMKYEPLKDGTPVKDKQTKEDHPPTLNITPEVLAAIGPDLIASLNAMIAEKGGGYTQAAISGGAVPTGDGGSGPAGPTPTPDAPEDAPDHDRFYSGHPDAPRPADANGPVPPVDYRPGREMTAPPAESHPAPGEHTRFASDRGYTSASAGPATTTSAAPAETTAETPYFGGGGSSYQPSASTPVATAAVRPAASTSVSTSPGSVGYNVGAAAPPTVNVNIDHEAIGRAIAENMDLNIDHEAIGESFANHMRDVLRHTTLKIEHPDGGTGTGSFNRRELGGEPSAPNGSSEPENHEPTPPGGTS